MKALARMALATAVSGLVLTAASLPGHAQIAAPQAALMGQGVTTHVDQVQYYYHRRRGPSGAAVGAAIAGGLLLGGAIAASRPHYYDPYYYGPAPVYVAPPPPVVYGAPPDDAVAYCMRRFRSYDPASGTYMGYDGVRRSCP